MYFFKLAPASAPSRIPLATGAPSSRQPPLQSLSTYLNRGIVLQAIRSQGARGKRSNMPPISNMRRSTSVSATVNDVPYRSSGKVEQSKREHASAVSPSRASVRTVLLRAGMLFSLDVKKLSTLLACVMNQLQSSVARNYQPFLLQFRKLNMISFCC